MPQICDVLDSDGHSAAEQGGVLSSAEIADNCGARTAEDGHVAQTEGQCGSTAIVATADDAARR